MTTAFQPSAFQNNAFQIDEDVLTPQGHFLPEDADRYRKKLKRQAEAYEKREAEKIAHLQHLRDLLRKKENLKTSTIETEPLQQQKSTPLEPINHAYDIQKLKAQIEHVGRQILELSRLREIELRKLKEEMDIEALLLLL